MDITGYVANIKATITNETQNATVTPAEVGNGLTDLAALTKTSVELKADAVAGKQLSTEDYTTAEKTKLATLTADTGITPWTAITYTVGKQVNYLGKDWIAKVATLATDVPGTSLKWANRLSQYEGLKTVKTLNLFSVPSSSANTILANGSTQAFSNFTTSDFIPVNVGQQYGMYYGNIFTPITGFRYYWFTVALVATDPTFSAGDSNGLTTAAPSNAAYLRVSMASQLPAQNLIIVEGTSKPTKYVKYGFALTPSVDSQGFATADFIKDALADQTSKDSIINTIQTTANVVTPSSTNFLKLGVNRLDSLATDFASGYALDKTNGTISVNSAFSTTGFMAVTPGLNYYFSLKGDVKTPLSLSAWYDSNKTYMSAVTYTDGSTTAPTGAAYIRACSQIAGFGVSVGYMFIQGDSLTGRFIPFGYDFDQTKIHVNSSLGAWDGKNWIALGDSITWQAKYFPGLIATTGLKNTYNLGSVGALLKTRADDLTAAMIADCDIVTVLGGTNDYGHGSATVGSVTDTKDMNTIHGNVAYVVDKILTLKPTVRVVFMTPTNRGTYATEPNWTPPMANPNGLTMDNIAKAIQDKCRYMSIPCYDAFGQSGINSYNFATYLEDGLHPNPVGATRLGSGFGQFINRISI